MVVDQSLGSPQSSLLPRLGLGVVDLLFRRVPKFVAPRSIAAGLRMSGVQLGRTTVFLGMPTLVGPGDIASRLRIGEHCGFNFGCHFELDGEIVIEDHVSVGHEVLFLTRDHESSDPGRRGQVAGAKSIRVGAGAWLGARCIVLPGVTIGAGAVVGASVVVRSDVPPNTLLSGARKISLAKWR
jgi:maltose O-acetyltransferase